MPVLLVEDDDAVRTLVRTIPERAGFHVLPASQSSDTTAELLAKVREVIDRTYP